VDELAGPSVVFLTATVVPAAPGAGVPTGTVTFLDGTTVLGTGTVDQNGQATLLVESGLSAGANSLTASYGGDGNFRTSTSPATVVTVAAPAATTTALSVSTNAAVFGQPVTLTATVTSPAGTPAGAVTFFEDGNVLGSMTLDAAGRATFTVAPDVGSHSLTASFAATGAFAASSSAAATVTVSPAATTTTLSASPNPVAVGQSVTLTAAVAAVAPGAGVPTGTVTFLDGTTVLAMVTLDATGKAHLRVRFRTAGKHALRAVYSGDRHFAASSQSLTEQVR
jgi:hypothetical protein